MGTPIIQPAAPSFYSTSKVLATYLAQMAVCLGIVNLVHHAVVHILDRRWHPADIQLTLLTRAAHSHIGKRVEKNCHANRKETAC